MKSPEYVASVVSVYRAALDRAPADPSTFEVLPAETERLEEAFNRGFTHGYLADVRDDADDELHAAQQPRRAPGSRGEDLARTRDDRAGPRARVRRHHRVLDRHRAVRPGRRGNSPWTQARSRPPRRAPA